MWLRRRVRWVFNFTTRSLLYISLPAIIPEQASLKLGTKWRRFSSFLLMYRVTTKMLPKQRSMHFPTHLHICIDMHLICTMSFILFWVSSYCSSSFDNALHWSFMRVLLRMIDSPSDAHSQPWFDAMGPNLRLSDFTIPFVLKYVSGHSTYIITLHSNPTCFADSSKSKHSIKYLFSYVYLLWTFIQNCFENK